MANTQLRRMLVLQSITKYPQKITTRQLLEKVQAQGVKTNIRAIQRDLEHISASGLFGVNSDTNSKPAGWYWMRESADLKISIMDIATAIAFEQMRIGTQGLMPKTTRDLIDPYFLQAEKVLKNSSNWHNKIFYKQNPITELPDIHEQDRETLLSAIDMERCVSANIGKLFEGEMRYQFAEVIHPLGLIVDKNKTFLVFSMFSRKELFSLPLHFLKDISLLDKAAVIPNGFSLEDYAESSPEKRIFRRNIQLEIITTGSVANYFIENPLATGQTINIVENNQFKITAKLHDTYSLRKTIRGFGSGITVTLPTYLKTLFSPSKN